MKFKAKLNNADTPNIDDFIKFLEQACKPVSEYYHTSEEYDDMCEVNTEDEPTLSSLNKTLAAELLHLAMVISDYEHKMKACELALSKVTDLIVNVSELLQMKQDMLEELNIKSNTAEQCGINFKEYCDKMLSGIRDSNQDK